MCIQFYGGPFDGRVECCGPVATVRHARAKLAWSGRTPYFYALAWTADRGLHYQCDQVPIPRPLTS